MIYLSALSFVPRSNIRILGSENEFTTSRNISPPEGEKDRQAEFAVSGWRRGVRAASAEAHCGGSVFQKWHTNVGHQPGRIVVRSRVDKHSTLFKRGRGNLRECLCGGSLLHPLDTGE